MNIGSLVPNLSSMFGGPSINTGQYAAPAPYNAGRLSMMKTRSRSGLQAQESAVSPLPLLPVESNAFYGAPMKNNANLAKNSSLL